MGVNRTQQEMTGEGGERSGLGISRNSVRTVGF